MIMWEGAPHLITVIDLLIVSASAIASPNVFTPPELVKNKLLCRS